jgi:hypothetical protein
MWGLLIAKRLDQSYDRSIKNSELWLGPIYYTLFWRCTTVLRSLPALASWTNLVQKNEFAELKRAHFNFLAINFTVWNHIPITVAPDALTPLQTGGRTSRPGCNIKLLGYYPTSSQHRPTTWGLPLVWREIAYKCKPP